MKRAGLAPVIRPKPGELKIAWPVRGSACTLRAVEGPEKFVWLKRLNASLRISSLTRSRIGNVRATARSILNSPGSRVVFRPNVPISAGSTSRRLAPEPVNSGPAGA